MDTLLHWDMRKLPFVWGVKEVDELPLLDKLDICKRLCQKERSILLPGKNLNMTVGPNLEHGKFPILSWAEFDKLYLKQREKVFQTGVFEEIS